MEPPAPISCSGNCLVHLHSAAGEAWLHCHSCPFKQHVGPDGITRFRVPTGNNDATFLSAKEIFTSRLQSQIADFESQHGQRVQNIVAIIPACTNPRQYQSNLSTIAAAAGVRIVYSIHRSFLAASAYRPPSTPERRNVLVFELGGRFLEISLLTEDRNRGRDLNIKAAVSDLGCPFLSHMVSGVPWIYNFDSERDAVFLSYMRTECERAKDALCLGSATVEVKIDIPGLETRKLIDREWLVLMNLDHLRSGITRCLTEARVRKEDVDEVVLAGASSNIPEVRGVLLEFFQEQKFRCSIDPANLIFLTSQSCTNYISSRLNIPVTIFEGLNLGLHAF
ncbi:hypothetical protein KFK09_015098 [Dendrobium nobile]|uniref:Uncharacterized protein n=1 Tax=Dendrobium nobile TaxID=94219 RepID=A0A8T3B3V4_DENNO|nr:hypothetical protein KFK09_015098 [Dendrobium nobile]